MVPKLLAPLAGLLMAALVAVRAQESPVQILETPAGPGSGMYALTPQQRPYRDGRFTEHEPILSWIDPLPEGGHALRFATLQGDRWSEPREVARGTNWFANWADHPSVVWAGDDAAGALAGALGRRQQQVWLRRAHRPFDRWRAPVDAALQRRTRRHAGLRRLRGVLDGDAGARGGVSRACGRPGRPRVAAPEGHHAERRKALVYTHFMPDGRAVTDVLDPDTCSCCSVATAVDRWQAHRRLPRPHARRGARHLDRPLERARLDRADDRPRGRLGHPGCPTNGPAVSADDDRVAVAWFTAAGGTPHVRVAFSTDAGASFGPPTDVDDGAPIGWAGVVLTDDGDAIVSWLESRPGGGAQVRLRRVREKAGPGAPLVVAETKGGRATGIPQLSRSGSRLLLAWRDERVRTAVVPIAAVGLRAPAAAHTDSTTRARIESAWTIQAANSVFLAGGATSRALRSASRTPMPRRARGGATLQRRGRVRRASTVAALAVGAIVGAATPLSASSAGVLVRWDSCWPSSRPRASPFAARPRSGGGC